MNDLIKQVDIEKIANEGEKIYEEVKNSYDPKEKGRFLAIDVDSKNVYIADDSAHAVELAKKEHPDKVFYVVKIGFSANEILASLGKKI